MTESEIQKLIVQFLNNEANKEELDLLENWFLENEDTSIFKRFVKLEYLIAAGMQEYDVIKAKKAIDKKINALKANRKRKLFNSISLAASIALIFGLILFFNNTNSSDTPKMVSNPTNRIEAGSNKAVLTLGNGNEIALKKGKQFTAKNARSNGNSLIYGDVGQQNIDYNYLTVPRGGQFFDSTF